MAWGGRGCDTSAVVESFEWGLGPAGGDDFGVPDADDLVTEDGFDE
jgi:hypothetical protein